MSTPSLLEIIESTKLTITMLNNLTAPLCEQDELDGIERLMKQRNDDIKQFFDQHTPSQLDNMHNLLDKFITQDNELTTLADNIKTKMAKLLIKQKKNTKAANAYQST